jgi:ABC-type molybdate transport system ATPase subunit
MENELRYYLKLIKEKLSEFTPTYIVTAVKLPNGAIELAVNTSEIEAKIDYILEAYDEDMCLKTNTEISMQNLMVV